MGLFQLLWEEKDTGGNDGLKETIFSTAWGKAIKSCVQFIKIVKMLNFDLFKTDKILF